MKIITSFKFDALETTTSLKLHLELRIITYKAPKVIVSTEP